VYASGLVGRARAGAWLASSLPRSAPATARAIGVHAREAVAAGDGAIAVTMAVIRGTLARDGTLGSRAA